jgi:hypothetical protein
MAAKPETLRREPEPGQEEPVPLHREARQPEPEPRQGVPQSARVRAVPPVGEEQVAMGWLGPRWAGDPARLEPMVGSGRQAGRRWR